MLVRWRWDIGGGGRGDDVGCHIGLALTSGVAFSKLAAERSLTSVAYGRMMLMLMVMVRAVTIVVRLGRRAAGRADGRARGGGSGGRGK